MSIGSLLLAICVLLLSVVSATKKRDDGEVAAETARGKTAATAWRSDEVVENLNCTVTGVKIPTETARIPTETASKRAVSTTLDVLAGKTQLAAKATIDVADDGTVTVTVRKVDGWSVGTIQVFAGPGWPSDWATKAPPPGQFPVNQAIEKTTFTEFKTTFKVGADVLSNVCGVGSKGGLLAIAVHTDSLSDGGGQETGWARGNRAFGGSRWGWYHEVCVPCDGSFPASAPTEVVKKAVSQPEPKPEESAKKVKEFDEKAKGNSGGNKGIRATIDPAVAKDERALKATLEVLQERLSKTKASVEKDGDSVKVTFPANATAQDRTAAANILAEFAVVDSIEPIDAASTMAGVTGTVRGSAGTVALSVSTMLLSLLVL